MEIWEWFTTYGEFFVVVFGPLVIAALPLLVVAGFFIGFGVTIVDSLYHIFGGR